MNSFNFEPEIYSEKEMRVVEKHIEKYYGKFENVFHELFSPIYTLIFVLYLPPKSAITIFWSLWAWARIK